MREGLNSFNDLIRIAQEYDENPIAKCFKCKQYTEDENLKDGLCLCCREEE